MNWELSGFSALPGQRIAVDAVLAGVFCCCAVAVQTRLGPSAWVSISAALWLPTDAAAIAGKAIRRLAQSAATVETAMRRILMKIMSSSQSITTRPLLMASWEMERGLILQFPPEIERIFSRSSQVETWGHRGNKRIPHRLTVSLVDAGIQMMLEYKLSNEPSHSPSGNDIRSKVFLSCKPRDAYYRRQRVCDCRDNLPTLVLMSD